MLRSNFQWKTTICQQIKHCLPNIWDLLCIQSLSVWPLRKTLLDKQNLLVTIRSMFWIIWKTSREENFAWFSVTRNVLWSGEAGRNRLASKSKLFTKQYLLVCPPCSMGQRDQLVLYNNFHAFFIDTVFRLVQAGHLRFS